MDPYEQYQEELRRRLEMGLGPQGNGYTPGSAAAYAPALAQGSAALPWAGFGLNLAGTAAEVTGGILAEDRAHKDREEEQRRYEEELRRRAVERNDRLQAEALAREFTAGTYAQNLTDRQRRTALDYNRQIRR